MLGGLTDGTLSEQLLAIARDPGLRQSVYERLGDYCHQCRNRLNSLKLSLFLAMRQSAGPQLEDWSRLEQAYMELERVVDRVQTICRPMTLSRVSIALDLLIEDRAEEWALWMNAGGSELVCVPPRSRALASFDVERIGQVLDALVRWRAELPDPDRSARLRWWVEAGTAHVSWDESRSKPGVSSSTATDLGRTWTLPLVARVLLAHGGEFRCWEDPTWRLELSWPAAHPTA